MLIYNSYTTSFNAVSVYAISEILLHICEKYLICKFVYLTSINFGFESDSEEFLLSVLLM